MARLLIQNGRLIDPSQKLDRVTNLLVDEGRIAAYDVMSADDATCIDAAGLIVAPGLVDIHAQFREPGREEDETIATGTAAALAGGYTSVACLPSTDPPIDTQALVEFVRHQAARADHCRVFVIACVSKGREGTQLAELGMLAEAGAVAFSDAPSPLYSPELTRRALEYCQMLGRPVLNHPEVRELTGSGVMHEGIVSLGLGLPGMTSAAEDVMISRDIRLAEATGGRIHFTQVSTAASVELVRRAKARNVPVTCGVAPHHFTLTDECLRTFDSNYKTNPPLRSAEDVEACLAGLADGTIDCIVSDHSPSAIEKKIQELDRAPFGVVSLETVLGLVVTRLVESKLLDWPSAIARLTSNPCQILGLDKGTLKIGADADITIIDPAAEWTVDPLKFRSKNRNTPFAGRVLRGRAHTVIVGGRIKYRQTAEAANQPVRVGS